MAEKIARAPHTGEVGSRLVTSPELRAARRRCPRRLRSAATSRLISTQTTQPLSAGSMPSTPPPGTTKRHRTARAARRGRVAREAETHRERLCANTLSSSVCTKRPNEGPRVCVSVSCAMCRQSADHIKHVRGTGVEPHARRRSRSERRDGEPRERRERAARSLTVGFSGACGRFSVWLCVARPGPVQNATTEAVRPRSLA